MRKSATVYLKTIFLLLSAAFILSACSEAGESGSVFRDFLGYFQSQNETEPVPETVSQTPEATVITTQAAAVSATPDLIAPTETIEPTQETYTIQLWIPPQFDTEQDTPGGQALAKAIFEYTETHPNISISLRVKAASGDSSAINTITAANHVAKDTLPSLVLLSRSDMETAVQRGLAKQFNTNIFSESASWNGFARQSSVIDNTIYSIPILGDCLVLTYRPAKTGSELTAWQDILTRGLPIGFAPSQSTSLFGTFIYLMQGSKLTNDLGQAYLDQQKLTDTLNFFLTGGQNGAFPPSLAQIVDQNQIWQRFNDGTMSIIISQFSSFRHYKDTSMAVRALPLTEGVSEYPLVSTWNLVLLEEDGPLQEEAVKFAEFLADPAVNDAFSVTSGYLPVRKNEHEIWQTDEQFDLITSLGENGTIIPNNQITNKLIPVINNAVTQVIKNQLTPAAAAQEAIAAVN